MIIIRQPHILPKSRATDGQQAGRLYAGKVDDRVQELAGAPVGSRLPPFLNSVIHCFYHLAIIHHDGEWPSWSGAEKVQFLSFDHCWRHRIGRWDNSPEERTRTTQKCRESSQHSVFGELIDDEKPILEPISSCWTRHWNPDWATACSRNLECTRRRFAPTFWSICLHSSKERAHRTTASRKTAQLQWNQRCFYPSSISVSRW